MRCVSVCACVGGRGSLTMLVSYISYNQSICYYLCNYTFILAHGQMPNIIVSISISNSNI